MEGAEFETVSKRHKPDHKQLFENLAKDLHALVTNKQELQASLELFLNNVVDEITQGIIFDMHRKIKTNAYDLDVDERDEVPVDLDFNDCSPQQKLKKTPNCVCPCCKRTVAARRFAPHLETCMGLGRTNRACNASRRVASHSSSKEKESPTCGSVKTSDDEEDANCSSGDKRKKKHDKSSKKSKGAKRAVDK